MICFVYNTVNWFVVRSALGQHIFSSNVISYSFVAFSKISFYTSAVVNVRRYSKASFTMKCFVYCCYLLHILFWSFLQFVEKEAEKNDSFDEINSPTLIKIDNLVSILELYLSCWLIYFGMQLSGSIGFLFCLTSLSNILFISSWYLGFYKFVCHNGDIVFELISTLFSLIILIITIINTKVISESVICNIVLQAFNQLALSLYEKYKYLVSKNLIGSS